MFRTKQYFFNVDIKTLLDKQLESFRDENFYNNIAVQYFTKNV